jgi:hypothetical protein
LPIKLGGRPTDELIGNVHSVSTTCDLIIDLRYDLTNAVGDVRAFGTAEVVRPQLVRAATCVKPWKVS